MRPFGYPFAPLRASAQDRPVGVLNVAKPPGWTSFQVVALVRRLSGVRRVGHAGTLDPLASGVLPLCLGWATRFVEYIQATPKVYCAVVHLGVETDTYDAEGAVTAMGDASAISRQQVEAALAGFVGEIEQRPPAFSAIKHQGVPLYRYARAGRAVEAALRWVSIFRIDLLDFAPPLVTVVVECSSGTYIRSLAYELGRALGCRAHLKELVRTRVGPFHLAGAATVDDLREAAQHDGWGALLYSPDVVLAHCRAAILGPERVRAVQQGKELLLGARAGSAVAGRGGDLCRVYSIAGELIGLLRYGGDGGRWHPHKVLPPTT